MSVTRRASISSPARRRRDVRSAVGYATTTSPLSSASHSASARVKARMPRKPGRSSARRSMARQRSDLLATRTGLPCALWANAVALAS
jgi:hypothetical protein